MMSWIVGLIAVGLWVAATLLYLRGHIKRAWIARRERREMAAKIRAQQAPRP